MPPHVSETCNESNGSWLPLIEYSVKTGISLSTIRRKIKSNTIQYRLEKGRYLILFNHTNNQAAALPIVSSDVGRWHDEPLSRLQPLAARPIPELPFEAEEELTLPLVDKAVKMVSDAFEYALREKDARLVLLETRNRDLEERLNELRLLVRVLEEKYEVRY